MCAQVPMNICSVKWCSGQHHGFICRNLGFESLPIFLICNYLCIPILLCEKHNKIKFLQHQKNILVRNWTFGHQLLCLMNPYLGPYVKRHFYCTDCEIWDGLTHCAKTSNIKFYQDQSYSSSRDIKSPFV